jgi:hypothetical protein
VSTQILGYLEKPESFSLRVNTNKFFKPLDKKLKTPTDFNESYFGTEKKTISTMTAILFE